MPAEDQEKPRQNVYITNYLRLIQFYKSLLATKNGTKLDQSLHDVAAENILQRGVDINYRIMDKSLIIPGVGSCLGFTLLHFAVIEYDLKSVQVLLENGADFTLKNFHEERTPLHKAFEYEGTTPYYTPIDYTFISEINKDFEVDDHYCRECNPNDLRTPEFNNGRKKIWKLMGKLPSYPIVDTLLQAHVKTNNTSNPSCRDGFTHFHIACATNNVEVVEFFLKSGVSVDHQVYADSPDLPGYSPLHFAARYGAVEVAELLLNNRADIHVTDKNGRNPLIILIERNMEIIDRARFSNELHRCLELHSELKRNEEMIGRFLEYTTDAGFSTLHAYCTLQTTEKLKDLLKHDIDINSVVERKSCAIFPDYTALHISIHFNIQTTKLLLQKGADFTMKNADGLTPLDLSIRHQRPEEVHEILSSIDSLSNIRFSDGKTKLSDAILAMSNSTSFDKFLKLLNDDKIDMVLPSDSPVWPGCTLFHLIIMMTDRSKEINCSVEEEDLYFYRIKALARRRADVRIQNEDGLTPIHLAFSLKRRRVIEFLMDSYVFTTDENIRDTNGVSFLHIACLLRMEACKKIQIIEPFVENNNNNNINEQTLCTLKWYKDDEGTDFITIAAASTPLHIAVLYEDEKIVKYLSDNGADVYANDIHGITPIHLALNNKTIAKILLDQEDLQDSVADNGLTHLHVAASANDILAMSTLIDQGSDINAPISYRKKLPEELTWLSEYAGYRPIHFNIAESAYYFIISGAYMQAKDAQRCSIIHHAMKHPELREKIIWLLKCKGYLTGKIDRTNTTLLHFAVSTNSTELVAELLTNGADPNARIKGNEKVKWFDCTPLRLAVREVSSDCTSLIQLLLDSGASVTRTGVNGTTAVHEAFYKMKAVEHSNIEKEYYRQIIYRLLKSQKNYKKNPTDKHGYSHFNIACSLHFPDIVEAFLQKEVGFDQLDDPLPGTLLSCHTPLHLALKRSDEKFARLLLSYGASIHTEDGDGNSPLHLIVEDNVMSIDMLCFFIGLKPDMNARNIYNQTPLEVLLTKKSTGYGSVLKIAEILVANGSHANIMNPITSTGLLALALQYDEHPVRQYDVFLTLTKAKDITGVDSLGRNAIHNFVSINRTYTITDGKDQEAVAVLSRYYYTLELLLGLGCDVNLQDKKGRTPLHVAVEMLNFDAVAMLLNYGANVNLKDDQDKTPYVLSVDRYTNENSINKLIIEALTCQMIRLMCIGRQLNKENLTGIVNVLKLNTLGEEYFKNFTKLCQLEFIRMKNFRVASIYLNDFFSEPKIFIKYSRLLDVEREILDIYFKCEKLEKKFPWLGRLLRLQFDKVVKKYKNGELDDIDPDLDSELDISAD